MSFSIRPTHAYLKQSNVPVKKKVNTPEYYFDPENPLDGLGDGKTKKVMRRVQVKNVGTKRGGKMGMSISTSHESMSDFL